MKLLKFLNHYNRVEIVHLYKQNPKYTFYGLFLGFPVCCIQSFINGDNISVIKNHPKLPSKGTGYVPCECCVEKVKNDWDSVQQEIQKRRTCSAAFPHYYTATSRSIQERQTTKFKKIFARQIKKLNKLTNDILSFSNLELQRSGSEFLTLSQAIEHVQNTNILDNLVSFYLKEAKTIENLQNIPYSNINEYSDSQRQLLVKTMDNVKLCEDKISFLLKNNYCLLNITQNNRNNLSSHIVNSFINEKFHLIHLLKNLGDKKIEINGYSLTFEDIVVSYYIYSKVCELAPPYCAILDEMGHYVNFNFANYITGFRSSPVVMKQIFIYSEGRKFKNQELVLQKYHELWDKKYKKEDVLSLYDAIENKEFLLRNTMKFNFATMNQEVKEKLILEQLIFHNEKQKARFKI